MSDKERVFYLEDELERQKHLRLEWARRIEDIATEVYCETEMENAHSVPGYKVCENCQAILKLKSLAEEMRK